MSKPTPAERVRRARTELTKARRGVNEGGAMAVRVDDLLGKIERVLTELQVIVEIVQDEPDEG